MQHKIWTTWEQDRDYSDKKSFTAITLNTDIVTELEGYSRRPGLQTSSRN